MTDHVKPLAESATALAAAMQAQEDAQFQAMRDALSAYAREREDDPAEFLAEVLKYVGISDLGFRDDFEALTEWAPAEQAAGLELRAIHRLAEAHLTFLRVYGCVHPSLRAGLEALGQDYPEYDDEYVADR